MIKILFVCHGNICRSTMAEFVFKYMIEKEGLGSQVYVNSAATSYEEIGNPPHYGTVRKLSEVGIPVGEHRAVRIEKGDYEKYDMIIGMDSQNIRNIKNILGPDRDNKVSLLLNFTSRGGNIADPWYTGNFDDTYRDVKEGCEGLMEYIKGLGK